MTLVVITILLQLGAGWLLGKRFFAHFMDKPAGEVKRLIVPYYALFLVILLAACLVIIALCVLVFNFATGADNARFFGTLFHEIYPPAIKYYVICALAVTSYFFYNIWRKAADREERLRRAQANSSAYESLSSSGGKERFLIRTGEHYKSIPTSDVICFYLMERSVFLTTAEGRSYPLDYSLDRIEQMVNPGLFFRVNRNYIINYYAIGDMVAWSSSRIKIVLAGGNHKEDILVSRDKVSEFKKWMDR